MGWQLHDPRFFIIAQAAFIYHQPNFSRISDSEYYALTANGEESSAGWMPRGPQMSLSVQPCYAISRNIAIGPTLGITARSENEVFTFAVSSPHGSAGRSKKEESIESITNGSTDRAALGYSSLFESKLFFLPNFGGTLNIVFQPIMLILDYGTQTGAGVGLAFKL